MTHDELDIWVGRFAMEDGDTVVYDPDIQISDSDQVSLFSLRSKEIIIHYPHHLRHFLETLPDSPETNHAISTYFRWKLHNAEEFIATEKVEVASRMKEKSEKDRVAQARLEEKIKKAREAIAVKFKERVIQNHRAHVIAQGIEYQGFQIPNKVSKRRTPHCYQCNSSLDNYFDIECKVCNWIICDCGACGCGWDPNWKP